MKNMSKTKTQTLMLLLCVLVQDVADGFEVTPATIAVEEGDDAFFYCGNEVSNAVWRLPNGIELGPEPGPAGSRIQAQYRLLELKPVMRGDEGTYTCFERNGQQRSATAMLAVNIPPRILNRMPVQEIHLGQSVFIRCEVELGNPVAELVWYKDNNIVDLSDPRITLVNTSLELENVVESDSGEYRCYVHNEVGYDELYITVAFRAIPQFVYPDVGTTVFVRRHLTFGLDCSAAGAPHPTFSWSFPSSSSVALQPPERGPVLTISDADISDGGEYQCSVTNEVGSITRIFQVGIVVPPFPSLNHLNTTVSFDEPVRLTCSVDGIPEPTNQWFLYNSIAQRESPLPFHNDRYKIIPNGSLEILKLEPSDFKSQCFMDMLCLSRNAYGESRQFYSLSLTANDCEKLVTSDDNSKLNDIATAIPGGDRKQRTIEIALIASIGSVLVVLLAVMVVVLLYFRRQYKRNARKTTIATHHCVQRPLPQRPLPQRPLPQRPLPPTGTPQTDTALQTTPIHTAQDTHSTDLAMRRTPSQPTPTSFTPHTDPQVQTNPVHIHRSGEHSTSVLPPEPHLQNGNVVVPMALPDSIQENIAYSRYERLQHYPEHRNVSIASTTSVGSTAPLLHSSSTSSTEDDEDINDHVFLEPHTMLEVASVTMSAVSQEAPAPEQQHTSGEVGSIQSTSAALQPKTCTNSIRKVHFSTFQFCAPPPGVKCHAQEVPLPSIAESSCPECMQQIHHSQLPFVYNPVHVQGGFTSHPTPVCPACAIEELQLVRQHAAAANFEAHSSIRDQPMEYPQVAGEPHYETIS